MNLLNQEILSLKTTISKKREMMNLQLNQSEKEKLRKEILQLEIILNRKLFEWGDIYE